MTASKAPTISGKTKKPLLAPLERTFNRLRTKIEALQKKQKEVTKELDASLQFYYAKMRSEEVVLRELFVERVKLSYQFYKTSKHFSKLERKKLKQLIINDINVVFSMSDGSDIPAEIKDIFGVLNGVNYDKCVAEELELIKNEMKEQFKEFGVDIDLSEINASNSQDEIMQKLFHSLGKAVKGEKAFHEEPSKTKKQHEKEQKKQAFEDMQKKTINDIYRQLARVLHPDLERDSEQKLVKEELMKKLTGAYKKNDLYGLLTLEMEWLSHSSEKMQLQSNEQLEVYNTVLKDQVKALQNSIDMLILHPKYMPIERYCGKNFNGVNGLLSLNVRYTMLKKNILSIQATVAQLKTSEAVEVLKDAIKELQGIFF